MHVRTEQRITSVAVRTSDEWFIKDGKDYRPSTRSEVRAAARASRKKGRPVRRK